MKPLTIAVLCFVGSRPIYGPWHVENMRRMCAKHITTPHRFVCITDDVPKMQAAGLDAVPLWEVPKFPIVAQHWLHNYVRLGLFDPTIGGNIGERILSIDLDAVIRRNADHLVSNPAPFRIMALRSRQQLQGGLFLIEPGALDPNPWRALLDTDVVARSYHWIGSDQAVLSELFYQRVQAGEFPTFNEDDGITINEPNDSWAIFFRTGQHKCWHPSRPECIDYFYHSDRLTNDLPPDYGRREPIIRRRGAYQKLEIRINGLWRPLGLQR